MSRANHRATGAALSGVAVVGSLLWWRFNPGPPGRGKQFPSDLLDYFYPRLEGVARRLAALDLPLWNPSPCGGIPELATAQTAVLHPFTWLFAGLAAVLSPDRALAARLLAECLLGGAFAALFLRRLSLDGVTSATGGILFVAGCLLGQVFWPPEVSVLLWLPWLLLCAESLLQRWRWRWWLGLVAGTALQALAGFPQFAAYTYYLLAAWAGARLWDRRGRAPGALRTGAGIALAVALGLGIAAVQLVPTAELAAESLRGESLGPAEVHYLGDASNATRALWNAVDPAPKLLSFDLHGGGNYLGIATLILLAVGVVVGRQRIVWTLLAVGALALVLSDGYRAGALYRAYAALPGVGLFRTPERLRVLTLFAAIVVACLGMDRVGRGFAALPRWRRAAALGVAALAALVVGAAGAAGAAPRAGAALALVALGAAPARSRIPRELARGGLFALVAVDLLLATGPHGPLRSFPVGFAETFHVLGYTVADGDTLAHLRSEAGFGRVEVQRAWPATGAGPLSGLHRTSCYEPLVPVAWKTLARAMRSGSPFGKLLFDADPEEFPAFYDVASVARIVVPRPARRVAASLRADFERFRSIYHTRDGPLPGPPPHVRVETRANADALPRAYVVGRFEVQGVDEALEHVVRGDVDFHQTVLLDRDPGELPAASAPLPARPARIASYEAERVEIEAQSPRAAILVLTDSWFPGWRAELDGRSAPILRANGLFRAVRLPAGRHRVVFEYAPTSFAAGLWICAGSLLVAGALPVAAGSIRRLPRRERDAHAA